MAILSGSFCYTAFPAQNRRPSGLSHSALADPTESALLEEYFLDVTASS